MNKIPSQIMETNFFVLETVEGLANRTLDEKCFCSVLKRFVTLISEGNSISNSLKNNEKVKLLIEDFKSLYFNPDKPDVFSHKLMQKIIKHPKVDEDLLDCMKIVTSAIFRTFEDCTSLIERPDNWLTHFTSTFLGTKQVDNDRNILKEMSKETLSSFFNKKCQLIKELGWIDSGALYGAKFTENLKDTLKSLDLKSPSFKEPPPYTDSFLYFFYKFEALVFEFPDHKEKVREALIAALDDFGGQ